MILQSIGAIKAFIAFITAVAALIFVYQAMLVVDRSGEKAFAADGAPETRTAVRS